MPIRPLALTLLMAAAVATWLGAEPAQAAAPNPSGMMAILRPCASADLKAAVDSDQAGMMHRELRITLTKTGSHACAIYGYPAVRLLDETRHTRIVAETFSRTPKLFTIGPNQQAAFLLRIATSDGVTTYRTVPTLAIIPPGDVTPILLDVTLPTAPTVDVTALMPLSDAH